MGADVVELQNSDGSILVINLDQVCAVHFYPRGTAGGAHARADILFVGGAKVSLFEQAAEKVRDEFRARKQ